MSTGYDLSSKKQKALRMQGDHLLVTQRPASVVARTRYTLGSSATNHTLNQSTTFVLVSTSGTVYIDFDNEEPSTDDAPVILKEGIAVIPCGGVSTLNIMGGSGAHVGIVEYQ